MLLVKLHKSFIERLKKGNQMIVFIAKEKNILPEKHAEKLINYTSTKAVR